MPAPAQPELPESSDAARPVGSPTSVRVAAIAMAVLASLLLVRAAVLWYGFDAAVHEITTRSGGVSRAEAGQWVLIVLCAAAVSGLLARSTSGWVPSLGARSRGPLMPGRSPAASPGSGTTRSTA